ncbi:MAG: hypothetical protein ABSF64_26165 [Bryobacteraceae bacterium]|jgi:hypothetical protein
MSNDVIESLAGAIAMLGLLVLVALLWEYALPGIAVAALLWDRLPHNVLAVLAGILTTAIYRWLASIEKQPVLGIMLVLRALLWGLPLAGFGGAIAGAAGGDTVWTIAAAIVGFVAGAAIAANTHPGRTAA